MTMRFGLIGAGAIAQTYAQAFPTTTLGKLVAVVDTRAEAASAMAEKMGCTAYPTVEAMLQSGTCDACIVSTPPTTHPEIVETLLANKLHVLCEKPLAIDRVSAQRMHTAAQSASTLLTMASKFRYVTDTIEAKSLVASGVLGDVVLFENAFTAKVDMSHRWNSNPAISGGGVLIDNGTHSVDIVRYFLGAITEVEAIEGKRVQSIPVEDTVLMFLRTQSGALATVDLSWSVSKESPYFISIFGSQGTLHVGWKESKYRRHSDSQWTVFGKGYDKVQAFRSQIENFVKAARGEEKPLITLTDALASVDVIESAYEALSRDRWVSVASRSVASAK